jgi:hypothetical protein
MRYGRRDPHDDPPRGRPRIPAPERVLTLAEMQRTPGGNCAARDPLPRMTRTIDTCMQKSHTFAKSDINVRKP